MPVVRQPAACPLALAPAHDSGSGAGSGLASPHLTRLPHSTTPLLHTLQRTHLPCLSCPACPAGEAFKAAAYRKVANIIDAYETPIKVSQHSRQYRAAVLGSTTQLHCCRPAELLPPLLPRLLLVLLASAVCLSSA